MSTKICLFIINYIPFNPFPNNPWFLSVCTTSLFENTVGKGEIARNKQSNLKLSSANTFSLEE